MGAVRLDLHCVVSLKLVQYRPRADAVLAWSWGILSLGRSSHEPRIGVWDDVQPGAIQPIKRSLRARKKPW